MIPNAAGWMLSRSPTVLPRRPDLHRAGCAILLSLFRRILRGALRTIYSYGEEITTDATTQFIEPLPQGREAFTPMVSGNLKSTQPRSDPSAR